ncbi:sugar transferase [Paramicrobacterium agarici]|uniref:sugar transferase n=1 Tax=Paramicrobacterium agarici TaxID=630514 RepID=UPI00115343E0|nr:sugar transferase [Microbacterium agarici]TQO23688.1 lipopolysaccharide/colanic/teichoic acid biosynthesis glycosyltransferase [Microbacterium agarici]
MSRSYVRIRSASDRLVALVLLVVCSPLLAMVALTIKIGMGGPVLFQQARVGYKGRVFEIIKFRTMVNGAESIGGGYFPPELNLVPPLGKFLRKSSLDELPQLLNIVRGDMSFVGPRPALVSQFDRYSDRQRERVSVPQGVTGLAQIRYRNAAAWSLRIEADLEYVGAIGMLTDLRILASTISRAVTGSGVVEGQNAVDVDDLGVTSPTRQEEK